MFAIGHFALGYLFGKTFSKLLDVKINMALLFTVSVIPDIDLLLFRFAVHRGATHSILFSVMFCSLLVFVYRKKAVPYCAALLSHALIGDIFSGGIQLFWPLSRNWVYLADLSGRDIISVSMELALFAVSTAVMLQQRLPKTVPQQNNQLDILDNPRRSRTRTNDSKHRSLRIPTNTAHSSKPLLYNHIRLHSTWVNV